MSILKKGAIRALVETAMPALMLTSPDMTISGALTQIFGMLSDWVVTEKRNLLVKTKKRTKWYSPIRSQNLTRCLKLGESPQSVVKLLQS